MRVFVSGATGVVGRRVVPLLVADGHDVMAIGRTPEKRAALERAGATAVIADLFSADSLGDAVAGSDAVVNLATRIPSSTRALIPGAWRENDRIRREGAANLVDAALGTGVERFIQESFAPIYEDQGDGWIDEGAPVRPARYSRSMLDAERAATRFADQRGTGIVLRFSLFYGPDSAHTRDMVKLVRRGIAPMPGSPDAFLSSIATDDAASAVAAAMRIPSGVYNVTDDEPLTRRAFFDALAESLHVRPPKLIPRWLSRLMGSMGDALGRSHRLSNRKLRHASDWAPRYPSVREGWRAVVPGTETAT